MARILFVGLEAGGNVPPAAAIATALVARGHDVAFAGYTAGLVDGTGSVGIPGLGDFDATRASSSAHVLAHYVHAAVGADIARQVADLIAERRPDAVVVDCMLLSAIGAATRSGAPTSVLFHTLAEYWLRHWARGPIGMAATVRGLRPAKVWGRAAQRLVVTERSLDPLRGVAAFTWTGSTESGAPPAPRSDDEPPLVLVSLSSTWFPGQADAYHRIVAALGDLPVRAIVTTGGTELEEPPHPAPDVDVRGRAPHGEILPHASLVVSHGGHSTVLRALAHGVPLLVMPMHPLLDQPIVGRAVADAGFGRVLPKSAGVTAIRDTVAALLADDHVAAATADMGRRLRGSRDGMLGGAESAAALIASLVKRVPPAG